MDAPILLSLSGRDAVGEHNKRTWKIGADGSNLLTQLSKGRQEFKAECSPADSKWAYFSDNTGSRVQRVSIDGGTLKRCRGADKRSELHHHFARSRPLTGWQNSGLYD